MGVWSRMPALFLVLASVFSTTAATAQSVVTEDLRIPMAAAGPEGLEAVLVKPTGTDRHPLVLVSHGSPREAADRPGMTARDMLPQITAFARRGFVAVGVLRRGYGSSPGGWAEGFGPCNAADYATAGYAGAADLKAAIAFLSKRSDVDAAKILAVGVSAGGFATVALTAEPPPGLVAAISFAGGRGSFGPDAVCSETALVAVFRTFGDRSRVPMLWVYAANDHFFGPALATKLYDAFERGGGQATFVHAPAFGADGHGLFSARGAPIWSPIVDAFLKTQGFTRGSDTAVVATRTLEAPRQLSASARKDFQTFLDAPSHKAFAVSARGGYGWRTARSTAKEASVDALQKCEAASQATCRLYAIDEAYADN